MPHLKHLRLIAMTGYGQAEDVQQARAAGFDAHLVKPVGLPALERGLAFGPPEERLELSGRRPVAGAQPPGGEQPDAGGSQHGAAVAIEH
jgi:CheY-like chemotaxis protein